MAKLNSAMSRTKKRKSSLGRPSIERSIKTSTGRKESSGLSKWVSTTIDQYSLMAFFFFGTLFITLSLLTIYPIF
ncbi:unnamed protein product [Caenorhabditis brenneri]